MANSGLEQIVHNGQIEFGSCHIVTGMDRLGNTILPVDRWSLWDVHAVAADSLKRAAYRECGLYQRGRRILREKEPGQTNSATVIEWHWPPVHREYAAACSNECIALDLRAGL